VAKNPLVLCILDGVGYRSSAQTNGNAVALSNPVFYNSLFENYPWTTLHCSGLAVGLPAGQMGNSEVGHLTIGSGRIIDQDLVRISRSFDNGTFAKKAQWQELVSNLKGKLHLLGLVSPGGVHSHTDHLYKIVEAAKNAGVKEICIHAFLDGRDTDPNSGLGYIQGLQGRLDEIGAGKIVTVSGRYWSMDRDKRWDRLNKSWKMLVEGKAETGQSAEQVIKDSYSDGVTDEFMEPHIIDSELGLIEDGDAVFFWNFRADRARELTWAFTRDVFDGFDRPVRPAIDYLCMTTYDASLKLPVLFQPQEHKNILAEVLQKNGMTTLRTAETEKYAHVTYFMNGGIEEPYEGEERKLVNSPDVATYDLQPEMSAREVANNVIDAIRANHHDLIIVNFANGDMVGHTGILDAAISAFKTLDGLLSEIVAELLKSNGTMLLTADHGNCEEMISVDGNVLTNHSLNEVPFVVIGNDGRKIRDGQSGLVDIAPTILELLDLAQSEEMTGKSLLV
jgi:2,3-bisphosphoglycerate-independent phosphoglycerate mutase